MVFALVIVVGVGVARCRLVGVAVFRWISACVCTSVYVVLWAFYLVLCSHAPVRVTALCEPLACSRVRRWLCFVFPAGEGEA